MGIFAGGRKHSVIISLLLLHGGEFPKHVTNNRACAKVTIHPMFVSSKVPK